MWRSDAFHVSHYTRNAVLMIDELNAIDTKYEKCDRLKRVRGCQFNSECLGYRNRPGAANGESRAACFAMYETENSF